MPDDSLDVTISRLNHRLQSLQNEYGDFTYRVSHDLRGPLRHIEGFSNIILRRHGHQFDEQTREEFAYIVDGVRRCKRILDGLGRLSRIQTSCEPPVLVDCNQECQRALRALAVPLQQSDFRIAAAALPQIEGARGHLYTLFYELIDNALRHNAPFAGAQLNIDCRATSGRYEMCIKDNGRGIEEKNCAAVFEPFCCLSPEEPQGLGMGLAVARRIVDLYDGEIWIQSQPGHGFAACISLPRGAAEV